jgi:hypothetical protein
VALNGYLAAEHADDIDAAAGTPAFVGGGAHDQVIPPERAERAPKHSTTRAPRSASSATASATARLPRRSPTSSNGSESGTERHRRCATHLIRSA